MRDEIDLYVPLSKYEDELAMKMTDKVEVDKSGKFVLEGTIEETIGNATHPGKGELSFARMGDDLKAGQN